MLYDSFEYQTPIVGMLRVVADKEAIRGVYMVGQKYFGGSLDGEMQLSAPESNKHLQAASEWLDAYFAGDEPDIGGLSIKPIGSEFRQIIWQLLLEIPYGQTVTYGDLAKESAKRMNKEHMASLAVGGAVGHNPIGIIIPCHRVVGASGSLTGYAGGISNKLALLEHEGVDCTNFFVPKTSTAP